MERHILSVISKYIASAILRDPKRVINPDASLFKSGLVDSFSFVDLTLFCEDQFGVCIDTAPQSRPYDTLNQLVEYIEKKQ